MKAAKYCIIPNSVQKISMKRLEQELRIGGLNPAYPVFQRVINQWETMYYQNI